MDVRFSDWLLELPDRPRSWLIDVLGAFAGYTLFFGTLALLGKWRASMLDPIQFLTLAVPALIILRLCRYAPNRKWLPFAIGGAISVVILVLLLTTSSGNDGFDPFISASVPTVILGVAAGLNARLTR